MQGLICAVFTIVYGQRFALRGKAGSMAIAVQHMAKDQARALKIFVMTLLGYVISMIGVYWIVMDPLAAMISTLIAGVASIYSYSRVLKIYNRFKFKDRTDIDINFGNENIFEHEQSDDRFIPSNSMDPTTTTTELKVLHGLKQTKQSQDLQKQSRFSSFMSFSNSFSTRRKDENTKETNLSINSPFQHSSVDINKPQENFTSDTCADINYPSHASIPQRLVFASYISINLPSKTFTMFKKDPWRRVYAIINDNLMFYYESKSSYENDPRVFMRARPIYLDRYVLKVEDKSSTKLGIVLVLTHSEMALTSVDEDFQSCIELKCDTHAEAIVWIQNINEGIKFKQAKSQTK